jgi:uncharacterized protein YcbK (DUF882 family)
MMFFKRRALVCADTTDSDRVADATCTHDVMPGATCIDCGVHHSEADDIVHDHGGRDIRELEVDEQSSGMSRRSLLSLGLASLVFIGATPKLVRANPQASMMLAGLSERRISIHNVNTGDSFDGPYWRNGQYLPNALEQLAHTLRDHRAGIAAPMDPSLYDLLISLQHRVDSPETFKVISGYRAPETNEASRKRSRGVAQMSYHMMAMAADVALPGRSVEGLYREATALGVGGVGRYPRSGFVHVDVGPVRTWGQGKKKKGSGNKNGQQVKKKSPSGAA